MADIKTSPVPKHHNIKLCICLTLALHRDEQSALSLKSLQYHWAAEWMGLRTHLDATGI
jgi:hypothetical protein